MEEINISLKIQTPEGYQLLNPSEITCVCPEKRKSIVYLDHHVEILAHSGIEEMEKLLDYPWFFRSHKSCLVNLLKIDTIDVGYTGFKLKCGTEFPISKRRKSAFKKALARYYKSSN